MEDSKKILIGAVIGGIIGITATLCVTCCRKKSTLDSIGEGVCELGDMVKNTACEGKKFLRDVEKKAQKGENTLLNIVDWAAEGITLWNKLKKGA